jgi:hypothetical protein
MCKQQKKQISEKTKKSGQLFIFKHNRLIINALAYE